MSIAVFTKAHHWILFYAKLNPVNIYFHTPFFEVKLQNYSTFQVQVIKLNGFFPSQILGDTLYTFISHSPIDAMCPFLVLITQ
jgi:hypothetical protein